MHLRQFGMFCDNFCVTLWYVFVKNFVPIWYFLRKNGIFCAYLGIFFPVLVCCAKENLATLSALTLFVDQRFFTSPDLTDGDSDWYTSCIFWP
jgi:hypothetical protein